MAENHQRAVRNHAGLPRIPAELPGAVGGSAPGQGVADGPKHLARAPGWTRAAGGHGGAAGPAAVLPADRTTLARAPRQAPRPGPGHWQESPPVGASGVDEAAGLIAVLLLTDARHVGFAQALRCVSRPGSRLCQSGAGRQRAPQVEVVAQATEPSVLVAGLTYRPLRRRVLAWLAFS